MKPNLKRGKSALLLALRGAGCRKVAAAWFPNDKRTTDLPVPDGTVDVLHVESSYVHLGTCVDKDGLLDGEAKRRVGMMGHAFEQTRGIALQNPSLDMRTRSSVFLSAVGSVAFNLELWTEEEKAWESLALGFWRLQRRLLARSFCGELLFKLQEYEVLQLTQQQALAVTAKVKRLGFLTCLVMNASEVAWAVVQWEGTWACQILHDLQWLVDWSPADRWPPVSEPACGGTRGSWCKKQAKAAALRALQASCSQGIPLPPLWEGVPHAIRLRCTL